MLEIIYIADTLLPEFMKSSEFLLTTMHNHSENLPRVQKPVTTCHTVAGETYQPVTIANQSDWLYLTVTIIEDTYKTV